MSRFLEFGDSHLAPDHPVYRGIPQYFQPNVSTGQSQIASRSLPHILSLGMFQYYAMNVVGQEFRARTPRLPSGRAIYLTRSLIHNVGKSRRCVCVCVQCRSWTCLSGLELTLHKPFTQTTD
jgi:hypothetical protein